MTPISSSKVHYIVLVLSNFKIHSLKGFVSFGLEVFIHYCKATHSIQNYLSIQNKVFDRDFGEH